MPPKNPNGSRPLSDTMRGLLISAIYAVFAGTYIITSSWFVSKISVDVEHIRYLETVKGVFFVVITSVFLFLFTSSQLRRVSRIHQDLEAQRKAFVQSERRAIAGLFASSLAHDANNMIGAIKMIVGLLRMKSQLTDYQAKNINDLESALLHLEQINRRLVGKRQSEGEADINRYSSKKLVEDTLSFASMHEHLRYRHVVSKFFDDPMLELDAGLFQQALFNLLLNAAEATTQLGKIEVHVRFVENRVHIEVHDDGPGISPETRAKIFQPFYTSKPKGNGLGMVAVRGFAELSNGTVEIEDSSLGGACIRIVLPVAPSENLPQK